MSQPPIIVKKVKKAAHGHHGGAWKIAYADFVTAMMAFFLLLWLLNAVTQEQLQGIADYFAPTVTSKSQSGAGDILGGKSIEVPGANETVTARASVTMDLPPPKAGSGGQTGGGDAGFENPPPDQTAEAIQKKKEEQQFKQAQQQLQDALKAAPGLKQLAKSLLIQDTPEGLRIQLVDQDGLAMFPSGSAVMYEHTHNLLKLVAEAIKNLPQDISISGHTDAVPFKGASGYSNWELSADRANAARRELVSLGIPEKRIAMVVGRAANDPLLKDDPKNARNRRLSIVLLRGTGKPAAPAQPRVPPSIINPQKD
ncbi:flagellar motor protein MotB [Varunaivibrio sulfuroxidans]|uniref:Chemotaxis protein MotB n=1 Tax=Varunaivibrio sulfuroxidans TaxID=1773489 RepID=A0A4V2UP23_9PROT|nr:flagellar motor protein MotB [Varunaivibrio sulfuroxidans]TCS64241.1 chemotaxis protein MotB [Varunaivibrio sulfuroxidans]WES31318.1 flagellar motor protein MotB [Varunaivibrio sulfuroxidans]